MMQDYKQFPTHDQVPFVTRLGREVTVDEGIHDILAVLRAHGVDTLFSCEGNYVTHEAYVLSSRKSTVPLVKRILAQYKRGGYSADSELLIKGFLKGERSHEFGIFPPHESKRVSRRWTISRGEEPDPGYRMEWLYSKAYGLRVCIRWPEAMNDAILEMLLETDGPKPRRS